MVNTRSLNSKPRLNFFFVAFIGCKLRDWYFLRLLGTIWQPHRDQNIHVQSSCLPIGTVLSHRVFSKRMRVPKCFSNPLNSIDIRPEVEKRKLCKRPLCFSHFYITPTPANGSNTFQNCFKRYHWVRRRTSALAPCSCSDKHIVSWLQSRFGSDFLEGAHCFHGYVYVLAFPRLVWPRRKLDVNILLHQSCFSFV